MTARILSNRIAIGGLFTLLVVAVALVFASCSNGSDEGFGPSPSTTHNDASTSADGDRAAFCAFVQDINAGVELAHSLDEQLSVLATFEPRFDQAEADAPNAIRPHITTMLDASRDALRTRTFDRGAADAVGEASYQLDQYCSK